jgi:SAM-dependent methyltransferase
VSRAQRPRIQVRQTRQGRELRIDGSFASWDPGDVPFGSPWGAQALSVLGFHGSRAPSVLILGLGGGTVARLVRALSPEAVIVGVERDPDVVRAARRDFGLDSLGVEVVIDDALSYLRRSGPRFDLISEDIYVGNARSGRKPDWVLEEGVPIAARRLRQGGIFVSNTIDDTRRTTRVLRGLFRWLVAMRHDEYDNTILAASQRPLSGRTLRAIAGRHSALRPHLRAFGFRTLVAGGH